MGEPYYEDPSVTLHHGDCIDVMRQMPDASVDAVVTDPPYGLEFMGKEWDRFGDIRQIGDPGFTEGHSRHGKVRHGLSAGYGSDVAGAMRAFQAWCAEWAAECYRVLKPGGHLLAFGGSRTYHRLAVGIEDAGFEIRDSIIWVYGSGFPKSMDVAKAIDKSLGVEGTLGDPKSDAHANWIDRGTMRGDEGHEGYQRPWMDDANAVDRNAREYLPGAPEAQNWKGWGTALKPSHEPVVVARKPLTSTVAANVLEHGTGALNIDATRVAFVSAADEQESKAKNRHADFGTAPGGNEVYGDYSMVERKNYDPPGRWPSNVVLDPAAAAELDRQTGDLGFSAGVAGPGASGEVYGSYAGTAAGSTIGYGDKGGASRYFPVFKYEPKAGGRERVKNCRCGRTLWASEDQSAPPPVATDPSATRGTDESSTKGDSASSTMSSGSSTTDPSLPGTTSTTSMRTSSTTPSATCGSLTRPRTSDSTRDAAFEEPCGGSPVPSAVSSSPSTPSTGTSVERDGLSTDDADRATSPSSLPPSERGGTCPDCGLPRAAHPTVKPLDLMRWLVRLVCPRDGVVLEPFAGSGTTAEACVVEGMRCIAIEREADYLPIIVARLSKPIAPVLF